ncbi:MAG TPA: malonate decarboxylase holo-[acyl-carrier-protein] synthase [Casimicrobiaceae bacterium]
MKALQRHCRVWPTAAGYAALASETCDSTSRNALALWSAYRWPFIVRRPNDDEPCSGETTAVGLALPPSLGKHRLALRLTRQQIAADAPPLALDEVVALATPKLRRTFKPLSRAAARERVSLRVFGSAAWQAQTGLDYVHVDSDLDLLATPTTRGELDAAIALLERMQPHVPMRIDGEIVFPGGDAVSWREWANAHGAKRVLVKNIACVALMKRDELLDRFDRCKLAA